MGLTGCDESSHDKMIDLSPILTRTGGKMRNNVHLGPFIHSWLMTKRTFRDPDDMFFGLIIGIYQPGAITITIAVARVGLGSG
jgi:hypothetical protein